MGRHQARKPQLSPICQIEKHHGVRVRSLEYFLITLHLESVGDQSPEKRASFGAALTGRRQPLYESLVLKVCLFTSNMIHLRNETCVLSLC